MIIKSIELKYVCGLNSKIPETNKKEFVLVGRSNVGKSSFINTLCNRKNYARTSNIPGKTRTINYYCINNDFYIVDLPGYGYAKASFIEQENWSKFINRYFKTSNSIEEIILLIDIRHKPSDKDISMYKWIVDNTGFEPIIILTKLDKIKKSEIDKQVNLIKDSLMCSENCDIILFSSITKNGVSEFKSILEKVLD